MVTKTGSQSSFRLLRSLPICLPAEGSPRLLVLSHKTAEIHLKTLALLQTLKQRNLFSSVGQHWEPQKILQDEQKTSFKVFMYCTDQLTKLYVSSNLGEEICVWQFAGLCFQAALKHYAETGGSREQCFHGDDASAALLSHFLPL